MPNDEPTMGTVTAEIRKLVVTEAKAAYKAGFEEGMEEGYLAAFANMAEELRKHGSPEEADQLEKAAKAAVRVERAKRAVTLNTDAP